MFNLDRWHEIFYSIKQNKLRTFLSGLTISLGLFIFILLSGIGNGLKNGFSLQFILDSPNLISYIPGITSRAYAGLQEYRTITLKNEDLDLINKNYSNQLKYKTSTSSSSENVFYKNESGNYSIIATYPEKKYIEKIIITSGRYLNNYDLQNESKFAVIGRLVQKDLFKNENPLGKYINIGNTNYKIIGVFNNKDGDNYERIIYIPIRTHQKQKSNTDIINQIDVVYNDNISPTKAIELGENIKTTLKTKLKISKEDNNGLIVRNKAENMEKPLAFFNVISFLVLFIGFGTIMAGIIGISNIMVFIVKERTKEIGVRKALGAHPWNIIGLILQESIFITLISGIFGALVGILVLNLIKDRYVEILIINPSVSWKLILYATLALVIFGAIAGFIPARNAAKIKPVEALKD